VVTEEDYKQAAARLAVARSRLQVVGRPWFRKGWSWLAILLAAFLLSIVIRNLIDSPAATSGSALTSGATTRSTAVAAIGSAGAAGTQPQASTLGCATPEQATYLTNVRVGTRLTADAHAALSTQFGRLASNALLFFEEDWRVALAAALVGMQLGADMMNTPAPVAGLEKLDKDIEAITREQKAVATELATAIEALDPKRVQDAGARLNSNRGRIDALTVSIEKFCG
jgi:hypothetical protein